MAEYLPDIAFVVIAGLVARSVARRMLVDSAVWFLSVTLASLVAITAFEPLVHWCVETLFDPADVGVTKFLWFFFAGGIFALTALILLVTFSRILGRPPEFGSAGESVGCWILGGLTGYLFAAFLLTVLHTVPAARDFRGAFEPEAHRRSGPVMAIAPDYQFLALAEYTCGRQAGVAGGPWTLRRPVISAALDGGRWASFPVRYALWREGHTFRAQREAEKQRQGSRYRLTPEPLFDDDPL